MSSLAEMLQRHSLENSYLEKNFLERSFSMKKRKNSETGSSSGQSHGIASPECTLKVLGKHLPWEEIFFWE